MKDIDNFVIGIKNSDTIIPPLEVNLPKAIEYMKKTGKKFENLTQEEIDMLKPSK